MNNQLMLNQERVCFSLVVISYVSTIFDMCDGYVIIDEALYVTVLFTIVCSQLYVIYTTLCSQLCVTVHNLWQIFADDRVIRRDYLTVVY